MQTLDRDLFSIQEVRTLIAKAKKAQEVFKTFTQEQVDKVVRAMAEAAEKEAVRLAKMANEETGFGKWEDKVIKNTFASKHMYDTIKNLKTVGIINEDKENKIIEVAVPVGVVAGLIPSTNPTSTVIYKALISVKAGNAIVFSPHPNAKNCILEATKVVAEAAVKAGAPEGLISAATMPSLEGTQELMTNQDTSLILATGGEAMVKAAYSSGTPAIGVGPGNGPAFIHKSADVNLAVKRIIDSKTFDNGVICASEQSVVVEAPMKEIVKAEFERQGAYFLNKEQSEKLGKFILRANGTMNPQIVGKSVKVLAQLAGLDIPSGVKVLISEQNTVGKSNPYSREKLTPILAFYCEESYEKVVERCVEILMNEGKGHTLVLHAEDQEVIRDFAVKIPVSRLIVNAPGALGGIGGATNLVPALTLGCGAVGGSATSDNVGPMNLLNVRRVAMGVRELEEIKSGVSTPKCNDISEEYIDIIVNKIIEKLGLK